MRFEDLTDERLDQALRRQPQWQPPGHFARAVVARIHEASAAQPRTEPSRLPGMIQAVLTGLSGAAFAYIGGMTLLAATPFLVENATVVGLVGAAAGVLLAAVVTGRAEEWI